MRDITLEETVYFNFTTRSFSTGVPTTLAGTPALSVLESNNATPITSGVSVSVDRASVTGLNQATVIATAANGYEAGKSYAVYISTGTVGGVSVVGEVVAQFTVQSGAAFTRLGAPAGASVSADVAAVKTQTAAIEVDTADIQSRLPAALVSGRIDASVGAIAANAITAASVAAGALDGKGNWNIGKTGYSLTATTGLGNQTADITGSLSGSVGSVTGAVGSVTGNVGGNVTGSVGSVAAGGITASSIAADAIGASELAADAVAEIAAAVLTTQMTESYRADAAAPTLAQAMCETLAHLGESSIASTTKTIKKFDGTTTAATFTLDNAVTPTSITRST